MNMSPAMRVELVSDHGWICAPKRFCASWSPDTTQRGISCKQIAAESPALSHVSGKVFLGDQSLSEEPLQATLIYGLMARRTTP